MNSWAQGEGQPGLGYIFWRQRPANSDVNDESLRLEIKRALDAGRLKEADDLRKSWLNIPEGVGPIANNLGAERTEAIRAQLGLKVDDAVFFVAGEPQSFVKFAGAARTKIGEELGLVQKGRFEFCWIVDFPMYEWNEEEKKIDFSHNPFSMPNLPVEEFLALDAADREKILRPEGDPIRHRL